MNGNLSRVGGVAFACGLMLCGISAGAASIRLDHLEIQNTSQDWGDPHRDRSVDEHPLTVGGKHFEHGLGTHATSTLYVTVNGAMQFSASVGVDGEVTNPSASIEFFVLGDGKTLWQSGVMRAGEAAKTFTVDLHGVKTLLLKVGDAGDGISYDHADWADARFEYQRRAAHDYRGAPRRAGRSNAARTAATAHQRAFHRRCPTGPSVLLSRARDRRGTDDSFGGAASIRVELRRNER